MHYQLIYELVDDYLSRREPFRAEHLALAQAATARGELVLAGALSDPADQAVLVFEGDSPEAAESFARADPYVQNGLVKSWRVRPWRVVVGKHAPR
ncbi:MULTISPECIES: YciI-like protein [Burkholderia]|uniref:YciI-like protein n=2 Tax=Burkholderia cepacia complex TaxID=87882 RepID=A0ABZ3BBL1_BURPY|nr:YciI-like protein [Burkholderia stabilis]BAX57702.1 YciI-like protein [Burkholderia stabilis]